MSGVSSSDEDEREHLYRLLYGRDGLRFCGCGNPEAVYVLVRDLLALAPFYENQAAVRERIGTSQDDAARYVVLYVLDGAGLTEHGSSIAGAWLTAKGRHYLPLMRRHEYDDLDEVGFPHDGEDCEDVKCAHWQACQA